MANNLAWIALGSIDNWLHQQDGFVKSTSQDVNDDGSGEIRGTLRGTDWDEGKLEELAGLLEGEFSVECVIEPDGEVGEDYTPVKITVR